MENKNYSMKIKNYEKNRNYSTLTENNVKSANSKNFQYQELTVKNKSALEPTINNKNVLKTNINNINSTEATINIKNNLESTINNKSTPQPTIKNVLKPTINNKNVQDGRAIYVQNGQDQRLTINKGTATDRSEEIVQFWQRIKENQEMIGVCNSSEADPNQYHDCPIIGRTRSLNAPSPIQQFGPCGRIMRNSAMVMTIQDPASQRLTWYKPPMTVLVIKKLRDAEVIPPFLQLVKWLILEKRMLVFVEKSVLDDPLISNSSVLPEIKHKLMSFREGFDELTDRIDFIICLGGDGTLLYASNLFQQSVPPVMAFHLGSLGFLTPFQFDDFKDRVTDVLEGHAALTLRSRLRCIILKKGEGSPETQNEDYNTPDKNMSVKNTDNYSDAPVNLLVLNEVVIDRGPSPYLSNIDLYLDGKKITTVQGDGLIVSTPTGSTAYAVAAGASMIHPSVPAIMVTPICPHSLSFRPIVVPAGVELMIGVSESSRNTAWVSFDGRKRQELLHGDSLRVTTSIYPVPSICSKDQISDWFASIDECLRWNDRKRQKHFDPDEIYGGPIAQYSSIEMNGGETKSERLEAPLTNQIEEFETPLTNQIEELDISKKLEPDSVKNSKDLNSSFISLSLENQSDNNIKNSGKKTIIFENGGKNISNCENDEKTIENFENDKKNTGSIESGSDETSSFESASGNCSC